MNALIAGMLGGPEVWIVCIVILVLFGGAAIPKFARSIGQAKKEFEEGVKVSQKPIEGKENTD
jgi:sec-independent protein translocase protein TatA